MQPGTMSSPDGEVLGQHKQANKELLNGPQSALALLSVANCRDASRDKLSMVQGAAVEAHAGK